MQSFLLGSISVTDNGDCFVEPVEQVAAVAERQHVAVLALGFQVRAVLCLADGGADEGFDLVLVSYQLHGVEA